VIAVGGATLGGSGKTPLAIACAAALAAGGGRVALVGHAYRAAPGRPRVVSPDDDVRVVGDEALLAARALAPLGGRAVVVIATTRQAALDRALEDASILVLDGVAQATPRRASVALLSVDEADPWGAAHCPPRGDLRAPVASLLRATDHVVAVRDRERVGGEVAVAAAAVSRARGTDPRASSRLDAFVVSRGAWLGATLLSWSALASMRVGLITTIARPSRVVAFLARRGVRPVAFLALSDHGPPRAVPSPRSAGLAFDVWLTTAKCALQLSSDAPLAVIDHAVELSTPLARALHPTLCADAPA
jgi:tetraacyldisaccharide 4'-kinase